MEIKWKQPIPLQSQTKQNLKTSRNKGNGLLNHVSTFSKSSSFLLPESSLVYQSFIALLSADDQLVTNQ